MVTSIVLLDHSSALRALFEAGRFDELEKLGISVLIAETPVPFSSTFGACPGVTLLTYGNAIVNAVRCNKSRALGSVAISLVPCLELESLRFELSDEALWQNL